MKIFRGPEKEFCFAVPFCGALIALGSPVALAAPDWSKVPTKNVPVIHPGAVAGRMDPGQGRAQWRQRPEEGRNLRRLPQRRTASWSLDLKRLAGKEMEPKGAPKTLTYPVGVQAAFDANNLYVRLTFKAPAGGFDKSDKRKRGQGDGDVPERQGAAE
jgi:hypothetical protein